MVTKMEIDVDFFEHLLNCMTNQKYISEMSSNDQKTNQQIIDTAWLKRIDILTKRITAKRFKTVKLCNTKDLVRELSGRTGVECEIIEPRKTTTTKVKNPTIILKIFD